MIKNTAKNKIKYEVGISPKIDEFYKSKILRKFIDNCIEKSFSEVENYNNIEVIEKIYKYLETSVEDKFFQEKIHYTCTNELRCGFESQTLKEIKKCPKCGLVFSSKNILNIENLNSTLIKEIEELDFFTLESENQTEYLIFESENQKIISKTGNNSFKDFLYLKFLEKKIPTNYLQVVYGSNSTENSLFKFLKENVLIRNIWCQNFRPNAELLFSEEGKVFFNSYFPSKYIIKEKTNELINLQESCPNICYLLANLTGKREDCFNYMLNYLGSIFNNPEKRTEKAINIFGEEGSGKGTLYNTILKPLYKYSRMIKMKELTSDYTDHYSQNIVLFIDEAKPNKDIEDELKSIITSTTIDVNPKYGKKRTEENYMNLIIASNENLSLTMGERRMVCFKAKSLAPTKEEREKIGSKLNKEIPKEINIFAQYLRNMVVDDSLVASGIDNIEKQDLMNSTKSIEKQFMDEFKNFESFSDMSVEYTNYDNLSEVMSYINAQSKVDNDIDYISINFILELYNNFRRTQSSRYSRISSNKFSWIYDELGINRDINKKEVIRRTISGQKSFLIKKSFILKFFSTENATDVILSYIKRNKQISSENFDSLGLSIENITKSIEKMLKNKIIFEPRKNEFRLVVEGL